MPADTWTVRPVHGYSGPRIQLVRGGCVALCLTVAEYEALQKAMEKTGG